MADGDFLNTWKEDTADRHEHGTGTHTQVQVLVVALGEEGCSSGCSGLDWETDWFALEAGTYLTFLEDMQ